MGGTAGPAKAVWFTNRGSDSIGRITTDGAVTSFTVTYPTHATVTTAAAPAT